MGGSTQSALVQFLPLIILIAVMYFLMIRPQRKKDKAINDMRRGLTVGDEIVTIGGICGKIVKTKDETIIVQVGADKIKIEMMRWAVSSVTKEAPGKAREHYEEVKEDEKPVKKGIKRLKKDPVEEFEETEEKIEEIVKEDEEKVVAEELV